MPACPTCKADNAAGAKFCKACGERLDQPAAAAQPAPAQRECASCHRAVAASAKFCPYCGASSAANDKASAPSLPAAPTPVAAQTPETSPTANQPFASAALDARADRSAAEEPPMAPPVANEASSNDEQPAAPRSEPPPFRVDEPSTPVPETPPVVVRPSASNSPTVATANMRSGLQPSRLVAVAAAVVLVLGAAAWYLLAPAGSSSSAPRVPDQASIESRVSSTLPAFVRLTGFQIQSSEAAGTPQVVTTRFRGNLLLTTDTFVSSTVEDSATIIAPRFKQGTVREITGTATSRPSGTGWNTAVSLNQDLAADLGTPRDLFRAARLIVAGSPEEAAFREEQRRSREATTQLAGAAAPTAPGPSAAEPARPAARPEQAPQIPAQPRQPTAVPRVATAAPAPRAQAPRPSQPAPPAPPTQTPPAAQPSAPPPSTTNAPPTVTEQPVAPPPPDERRLPPEPVIRAVEVPVGTELDVRLSSGLNSGKVAVEDRFEATVLDSVTVGGRVAIPAGSVMRGIVTAVQPATRTNRTSRMTLNFDQVTVNGRSYPMRGTLNRVISGPGIKGEATRVGAGAAVGAVIGGILGGAKGALAGLAIGGGGVLAATEGKEVDLQPGTVLRVRVDSPIQIQ